MLPQIATTDLCSDYDLFGFDTKYKNYFHLGPKQNGEKEPISLNILVICHH